MSLGLLLALSSTAAASCPEGWTSLGCAPTSECCPTRALCERQVELETQAAARKHLGDRYDEALREHTATWQHAEAQGRACLTRLDLLACPAAEAALASFLARPATLTLTVAGGSAVVRTACGEERVFFDGQPISFDLPHRPRAAAMRRALADLRQRVVHNPARQLGHPSGPRPPGAPPGRGPATRVASTTPAGVSPRGDSRAVHIERLYADHEGDLGEILVPLRLAQGSLQACYAALPPHVRQGTARLGLAWRIEQGRVDRVDVPRDEAGGPELAQCLSEQLAQLTFAASVTSRVGIVLELRATPWE